MSPQGVPPGLTIPDRQEQFLDSSPPASYNSNKISV